MRDIEKIKAALLKQRSPEMRFKAARSRIIHDLSSENLPKFNDNLEQLTGMTVALFVNRFAEKIISRSSFYPLPKKEQTITDNNIVTRSAQLPKPIIRNFTHSWFSENIAQMQEERRSRHSFVEKVPSRRLKEMPHVRPNPLHLGYNNKKTAYNPLKAILEIFLKGGGPGR